MMVIKTMLVFGSIAIFAGIVVIVLIINFLDR